MFGGQSMFGKLRRVIVRKPDQSFGGADPRVWHYTARPNLDAAIEEHKNLVHIMQNAGVEIIYHDIPMDAMADAIYVFDPVLITDKGAILLNMGKKLRRGEEISIEKTLKKHNIPILDRLSGDECAEGGDLLWLDEKTLAVGVGFRTNIPGFSRLKSVLTKMGIEVIPVELPYFRGADACLHLLSLISIVDYRLAVIYPSLLSVPFWQRLQNRGFRLIEVPDNEFLSMGPNVLALSPGTCVVLAGNPVTRQKLESAGCIVHTYTGDEISLKAEGGPTCLTRPVWRDDI
jgi:N-dimethylarginine dimethylaminohydrolase